MSRINAECDNASELLFEATKFKTIKDKQGNIISLAPNVGRVWCTGREADGKDKIR